nr:hypothetical protein [Tanacetum cinerariifolium]
MGNVTLEQIMDEYVQKNKPADEDHITFLGSEPVNMEIDQTKSTKNDDSNETDYELQSMPKDDLVSLSGFEATNFDDDGSQSNHQDNLSKEGTAETLNASADMPAQSDPLGHLQKELRTLNTKVDQLESSISKKVTDAIYSSVP